MTSRANYYADPVAANTRARLYRETNPEKVRAMGKRWRTENADHVADLQRANYLANQDQRIAYERDRRERGVAAAQERSRRAADPDRYRKRSRDARADPAVRAKYAADLRAARAADPERFRGYDTRRYATPKGNVDRRISAAIVSALRKRGQRKTLSKSLITGWNIVHLVAHLEARFEVGMTFENYGEWEIDHIVPLSKLPYTSEDDPVFKLAWSLSNLAPLWSFDNAQKSNRLDWILPPTYKNPLLRRMYDGRNLVGMLG